MPKVPSPFFPTKNCLEDEEAEGDKTEKEGKQTEEDAKDEGEDAKKEEEKDQPKGTLMDMFKKDSILLGCCN